MTRKLVAAFAVLTLLAACGGRAEEDDPQRQDAVNEQAGNGNDSGDGNGNGNDEPDEEGAADAAVNQPPPDVRPSIPGPGEPTRTGFRIEGQGSDRDDSFSRPVFLLARSRSGGERAISRSPTSGPGEIVRAWDRYSDRALLAVFGGAQPDDGHRIEVTDVSVTRGGRTLTVFARILAAEGAAQEVVSVPWAVVSVDAGVAALARRCVLTFDGRQISDTRC